MDLSNLVPYLAAQLGVAPTTLLLLIGLVTCIANTTARLIPNNATGWLGTVRTVASIIGVYVSSRVAAGVTVNDVAAAQVAGVAAPADPPRSSPPILPTIAVLCLLPIAIMLASCGVTSTASAGSTAAPGGVAAQITLRATTGLSLAELAYNSAEATATAVLRGSVAGKHLSPADATKLGAGVHAARGYRDQARALIAAGSDASAVLEQLNAAIVNIQAITGPTAMLRLPPPANDKRPARAAA